MVVEDHEISITRAEIVRLWERAFGATYPEELEIEKGLEAVMMHYGVQRMLELS
jgi:hypothetical protein